MKKHLPIVFLLTVAGCSKKGEECPPFLKISNEFGNSIAAMQVGNGADKDLAAAQQVAAAIQHAEKQLNGFKPTDEKLIVLKDKMLEQVKQAGASITQFMQTVSQIAEADKKIDAAAGAVDEAKNALKTACDKKERWKKSIRVKKEQCDGVNAQLGKLPDSPTTDNINSVVAGLKGVDISFSAVRSAVEDLAARLNEQAEAAASVGDLQKAAEAFNGQLAQQNTLNAAASKALTAYCAE